LSLDFGLLVVVLVVVVVVDAVVLAIFVVDLGADAALDDKGDGALFV